MIVPSPRRYLAVAHSTIHEEDYLTEYSYFFEGTRQRDFSVALPRVRMVIPHAGVLELVPPSAKAVGPLRLRPFSVAPQTNHGKIGKGTGSFGKRRNKSHTLCRRYVSKRPGGRVAGSDRKKKAELRVFDAMD